jgi:hypothetical protein
MHYELCINMGTAVYAACGGNHSETLRSLNDDGTYQALATFVLVATLIFSEAFVICAVLHS